MTTFLRQLWTFFIATLKGTFRSFSAVFFGLLFPIVFVSAFGFSSSNGDFRLDVGLVDSSAPSYSVWDTTLANLGNGVRITKGNKEKILEKMKDNSLDTAIEVNTEKPEEVIVYTNAKRIQSAGLAKSLLSTVIDKQTIKQAGLVPIFTLTEKPIDSSSPKYIDFVLPGLIGFSLLASAIQGLSNTFLTLKKTQALKRLFAAPASISAFLLGNSLARLVFSMVQVTLLLTFAHFVFDYNPTTGLTGFAGMLGVSLIGVLVFQGFGYILAGIASTAEQSNAFSQLITLPQFMLGGTFFAVATLPLWLQPIVKVLPLYSFNEAMRKISLDGLSFWSSGVFQHLWPLGVWGLVLYAIASKVFRVK